jgi:hypothetical protein
MPSERYFEEGGILNRSQCIQVPEGASGSSQMTTRLLANAGTPDQESGGDTSSPSQVYLGGINAPSEKAVLLILIISIFLPLTFPDKLK